MKLLLILVSSLKIFIYLQIVFRGGGCILNLHNINLFLQWNSLHFFFFSYLDIEVDVDIFLIICYLSGIITKLNICIGSMYIQTFYIYYSITQYSHHHHQHNFTTIFPCVRWTINYMVHDRYYIQCVTTLLCGSGTKTILYHF